MKQLDHPNIVKTIDILENEEYIYIVMELMGGGDLYDSLEVKQTCCSEKETRDVMVPIFDAVFYCHEFGLLHRDLKLENLLCSSKNFTKATVKIADFGLSEFIEKDSCVKTMAGSPIYVAPEVLK